MKAFLILLVFFSFALATFGQISEDSIKRINVTLVGKWIATWDSNQALHFTQDSVSEIYANSHFESEDTYSFKLAFQCVHGNDTIKSKKDIFLIYYRNNQVMQYDYIIELSKTELDLMSGFNGQSVVYQKK